MCTQRFFSCCSCCACFQDGTTVHSTLPGKAFCPPSHKAFSCLQRLGWMEPQFVPLLESAVLRRGRAFDCASLTMLARTFVSAGYCGEEVRQDRRRGASMPWTLGRAGAQALVLHCACPEHEECDAKASLLARLLQPLERGLSGHAALTPASHLASGLHQATCSAVNLVVRDRPAWCLLLPCLNNRYCCNLDRWPRGN